MILLVCPLFLLTTPEPDERLSLGPLANPIDFIEPLQWFPNKKYARANQLHDDFIDVYGSMILAVKARMDAGEDVPDCLAKTLIEAQQLEKLDWEDMCMLSLAFGLAGVHSVRDSNISLLLVRVLNWCSDVWNHSMVPRPHWKAP